MTSLADWPTDALSAFLASFTNSFPDTAFAENVGLVGLTGVRSRWVVTTCGVFLLLLGLIPKVGADRRRPARAGDRRRRHGHVLDGHRGRDPDAAQGQLPRQPQPADRRGVARRRADARVRPDFYDKFPKNFQVIFGSSITATVIVVFVLNLVFNHWSRQHATQRVRGAGRSRRGRRVRRRPARWRSGPVHGKSSQWCHPFDSAPDDDSCATAAQLLRRRGLGGADGRRAPVPVPRPRCTASDHATAALDAGGLDAGARRPSAHRRRGRPAGMRRGRGGAGRRRRRRRGRLDELAAPNAAYEQRFGHVYLVCASGRSAAELLASAGPARQRPADRARRRARRAGQDQPAALARLLDES